jgi:Flp pilus assembly protein TadB
VGVLTRPSTGTPRRRDDGHATDLLRLRAAAGVDLGDPTALPPRARRAVLVAADVGAPLLEALEGAANADEDARRAARAVAVASAQTRAVAGGLLLAPFVLVPGLGRLVGADLLGFYATTAGAIVGLVGLALLAAGAGFVAALVRRVARPAAPGTARARRWVGVTVLGLALWWAVHPAAAVVPAAVAWWRRHASDERLPSAGVDEVADLTATALTGGIAPGAALRVAADQLPAHAPALHRLALDLELGLPAADDPTGCPGLARLRAVLTTAADVGAAAAPALRRLARDLRADDLARVLAAAERLPAQLTFPTALCLLPATLLLVGAPMVHAGLAAAAT